jgi:acyl-CoA dehydrogenase
VDKTPGGGDGATELHKVTLARQILAGVTPSEDLCPAYHLPSLKAEARKRYAGATVGREGGEW